jgi:hypothetical protein
VVNGWTARDLLVVVAREIDDQGRDERVPTEIALAVVGLAVFGFTTPAASPGPRDGGSGPAEPPPTNPVTTLEAATRSGTTVLDPYS